MVASFLLPAVLCGKINRMDAVDRKILAELQQEGRLTVTELAGRIPLSVSRCQRRVRELEARGVVRGYHADVDPAAIGLGFTAIVFVTMHQEDQRTVAAFEAEVAAVPAIVSAQRLFGDPDYLLRVVAADLDAYRRIYDEQLAALPGVQRLTSTLVMKDLRTCERSGAVSGRSWSSCAPRSSAPSGFSSLRHKRRRAAGGGPTST
jgi:DNA-binding Lrp family transcriptional regulator